MRRIQRTLRDHIVVVGYGTKNSRAVQELIDLGAAPETIVVIDNNEDRLMIAKAIGCTILKADATRDETLLFCLEVDRGTMPVVRSNPAQSSFYRKLLAYHETWRSGQHVRELGWRRFRVLTLTSSLERRDHLVEVCREVVASGGSGLFMFADRQTFSREPSLAAMPWLTGDGMNVAKILAEARG